MKVALTPLEARVIGCLMEKEVTTPENYPLSINALTSACNQKSNRDPAMDLDEGTVQRVVDGLQKRHLVSDRSGYGGRVPKYKQVFCNTELGPLQFTDLERAIVCELLLRGPQSAGELRTRCARMALVGDAGEVEAALDALAGHPQGPFVTRLPRAAGMRDARYAHLLGDQPPALAEREADDAAPTFARQAHQAGQADGADGAGLAGRVQALEARVAALQREVEDLKAQRG